MLTSNLRLVFITFLILLAGCATTYTDANLRNISPGQTGTLEQSDPIHSGVVIDKMDGVWLGLRPKKLYQLAPGEHSLAVRANLAFYSSSSEVRWFDVAPGGSYSIQTIADTGTGGWAFGIIDKSTGERIDRLWSEKRP